MHKSATSLFVVKQNVAQPKLALMGKSVNRVGVQPVPKILPVVRARSAVAANVWKVATLTASVPMAFVRTTNV